MDIVTWLADLLQNEPEGAAALLIVLAVWTVMNTIFIVSTSSDIDSVKKKLRKRGIWL